MNNFSKKLSSIMGVKISHRTYRKLKYLKEKCKLMTNVTKIKVKVEDSVAGSSDIGHEKKVEIKKETVGEEFSIKIEVSIVRRD